MGYSIFPEPSGDSSLVYSIYVEHTGPGTLTKSINVNIPSGVYELNQYTTSTTSNSVINGVTRAGTINSGVKLNSSISSISTALPEAFPIASALTTWTTRTASTLPSGMPVGVLRYQNNLYTIPLYDKIYSSTDGISWTTRDALFPAANIIQDVVYGNGLYVAIGQNGQIRTSTDLITWATRTSNLSASIQTVIYNNSNNIWLAIANSSTTNQQISTSTNGITWTTQTNAFTGAPFYIRTSSLIVDGKFTVGYGYSVFQSTNGVVWTSSAVNIGSEIRSLTYGNGTYLAGGATNRNIAYTSSLGVTWTSASLPLGGNEITPVRYGKGVWVAVAPGGTATSSVAVSANLITWTTRSVGAAPNANALSWDDSTSKLLAFSDSITTTESTIPVAPPQTTLIKLTKLDAIE